MEQKYKSFIVEEALIILSCLVIKMFNGYAQQDANNNHFQNFPRPTLEATFTNE